MIDKKCNLSEMQIIAANLAKKVKKGAVICLFGNLGVGKTTFSKALIKELTGNEEVTSPTFNIIQTYEGNNSQVSHFDLYRVKNLEELNYISIDEALESSISIIEWPEIAANMLPSDAIKVYIDFAEEQDHRIINISY
ncbi:MAG: tRNA (adenosine(37)-N6)-threonylcarbamoyltransferase complex ATPase subunit type 1 TsaE [Candidatus Midichloria sp.]|nr:MAG: tRNA (adenosine(37)-N6)-threonylcarbamoyltransferase complex ATPase subunit type 1 TsaE [Candidatus Midichloria sp.]